mgnify:CR=1 FL=1
MKYYLSLGSNVGNRLSYLKQALHQIGQYASIVARSALYESAPVGAVNQNHFLNALCIIRFEQGAFRLLRKLKYIESRLGRNKTFRWGPREIDIDIIDCEGAALQSNILTIPHEQMRWRKFVLLPLAEIDPNYISRDGQDIQALLQGCPENDLVYQYQKQW